MPAFTTTTTDQQVSLKGKVKGIDVDKSQVPTFIDRVTDIKEIVRQKKIN